MTESRLISRIVPYEVPELRGDWALSSLQNLWILISHVLLVMRYSELYFYIEEHYFEIVPQLVNVFFVESLHSVFISFHTLALPPALEVLLPAICHVWEYISATDHLLISIRRLQLLESAGHKSEFRSCSVFIFSSAQHCVDGTACTQQQPSWFLVFIPHSAV